MTDSEAADVIKEADASMDSVGQFASDVFYYWQGMSAGAVGVFVATTVLDSVTSFHPELWMFAAIGLVVFVALTVYGRRSR